MNGLGLLTGVVAAPQDAAEAERLVSEAPHIQTEADLWEGLQYLAGCISGCAHLAFDHDRDHPMLQSGTGPFTKMGLDNPDTMYFGTRVVAGNESVVTGTRGTTTDVSFQLLGGDGLAALVEGELDAADTRAQVLEIPGQGQNGHQLGGGGDDEAIGALDTIGSAALAEGEVAKRPVVHV